MIAISYYGQLKELLQKPKDLHEFNLKEKLTIENIRSVVLMINKSNTTINKIEHIIQKSMIAVNDEYIEEDDEIEINNITMLEISIIPPISGG